jgi:hypothetical protein
MTYIVCQKKRNNPRMDIRICMAKCDLKDDCLEFQAATSDIPIQKDNPPKEPPGRRLAYA